MSETPHVQRFKLERWATQTGFVKEKKEQSMSEVGFLEQCVKLNKFLVEAHEIAARIVGPTPQDKCLAEKAGDCLTGRLDDLIRVALDDAQDLIGQLNQIADRFDGSTPETKPR